MRRRFEAAESQLGEASAQGGEGEEGPALSLLGMSGRLSRMDAAKLFYQVLGKRCGGAGRGEGMQRKKAECRVTARSATCAAARMRWLTPLLPARALQ
jgi:hypothetical protein